MESRALQQPNGLNTNPGNAVSLNLPVRRTASRTSANAADPRCLKQYLTPKMVLDSGKGQPPGGYKELDTEQVSFDGTLVRIDLLC